VEAFLRTACQGDDELRREVHSLLTRSRETGSLINQAGRHAESAMRGPAGSSLLGLTVAHYQISSFIGSGAMGEVYRARDTKLKRDVAVKVLPAGYSRDPDRVSRFQREAEALATLNHPNIASIYDVAELNQRCFLVLELVQGDGLADQLRRGALPVKDALRIAGSLKRSRRLTRKVSFIATSNPLTLRSTLMEK
jgi:serine/threonine protein kinase